METQETLETKISRLTRVIALIGLAGLLILSGITVGEVLIRWIFKFPIQGVFDLSQLVIVIIISTCLPMVSAQRRHITVRLAGTLVGPRGRAMLEAFGDLITMLIFSLMTWQLWMYTNELSAVNEATWLMHWPVAPWWRTATVIIALCVPIQFFLFLISLRYAFASKGKVSLKSGAKPGYGT